tara:strand:+ start:553 stop:1425 length:873 start_codon:yes stop_codon:yes gene_type:complete
MKTLFLNYSSALSTEAMYLHRSFIEAGEEAVMWNPNSQSAFDTFDYVKPDVFVTHFAFLTNDIIKYLSKNKKISMALNVTGATKEQIQQIESFDVNLVTMFTNLYESNNNLRGMKSKINGIYPGADIFLPVMPTPEYNLNKCFLSLDNNDQLKREREAEEEYHVMSFTPPSADSYADMNLDITSAVSFYHKYKTCHLVGDINFVSCQILFDSLLKANRVKVKVPDSQQEMLDSIFASLFLQPKDSDAEIGDVIKGQVRRRHNCFKRAARLSRFINNSELSSKLERMGESI